MVKEKRKCHGRRDVRYGDGSVSDKVKKEGKTNVDRGSNHERSSKRICSNSN